MKKTRLEWQIEKCFHMQEEIAALELKLSQSVEREKKLRECLHRLDEIIEPESHKYVISKWNKCYAFICKLRIIDGIDVSKCLKQITEQKESK